MGDSEGLQRIQKAFSEANPGYQLEYFQEVQMLPKSSKNRITFIQTGGGTATLSSGSASKFSVGDIILLKPEESLQTDSLASFLVFTVPEATPEDVPTFIRPDWDENITDTPGGCATESGAYRRILLTWQNKVGPYRFHGLNAHRVRIMNSFTHYHPKEGGFDEFYLVQMAMPNARLLTSTQVPRIENPEELNKEDTKQLIQSTSLEVDDLVYLPRGMAHRGLDGVLAHVITVPGFVPGSEIGIDHHLRLINARLRLSGKEQLPYNEEASKGPVIK